MMCRPPGGLPSKSPVTTPAPPAPGTERQTDHQRAVPPAFSLCQLTHASGAVPPAFSLCQLTRASASWGLSLPARPRSAPSPDKEPPGYSHTPLAGPTISDTYPTPSSIPPPPGSCPALWSSRGTLLPGSPALGQQTPRDSTERLPPSPWSGPRPQQMEESGTARPHPGCTVTPAKG